MRKLFLLLMFMLAGVFSAMGGEYIVYQPTAPIVISYSGSQPTIPAENFVSLSDDDEIVLRITNIGSKSGDNAPKYKLITDSWDTPTVAETVITSTDGTITYTVEEGVAAKIKASGLTISGQNYSLLDVVVNTSSSLENTWTIVNVYNGSTVCNSGGSQINITDRTYSDVKVGDILSIDYSDASDGQIFLQYSWGGTYHDHGGLSGSGTVEITIDSDLLTALGNSAQVYGKNITVGTISIQRNVSYVSTVTDITYAGEYTLGNYISEQQINITDNTWTGVETGDYLAINYTVKSNEEGELYIRNGWNGDYYHHSHLIGTSAMIYIEVDETLSSYFTSIQLYCKTITINSISVVRNEELVTPGYRPVYIPSSGYATFYASSTCALPDGVKAYYVNGDNIESDLVKMTEIDNIPANTGVVLKGTTGIYQLYATDAIAASTTNNRLKGATTRTQITSEVTDMDSSKSTTAYVLYNNSGSPEFRLINENTYLDAYKCYLETDGTKFASRLLVYFFDETSGIAQPENKSHECLALDKAYNLCGQRINVAKGLYIQNGKKYFAK